ncbi:MAG: hypothetical protein ACRDSJ_09000 [Rubrobacteraceae bacterium]
MNAGIPGIGLGGLFFVLSAFLMLFIEIVRTLQGRSSLKRWRLVGFQSGIAGGIVAATVVMLWMLEILIVGVLVDVQNGPDASGAVGAGSERRILAALEVLPVSAAPLLGTFTLLALILFFAEALRWIVRRPKQLEKALRAAKNDLL